MGLKIDGHVEKVNGKELSYSEFVERYLEKNQPVVLTGLMDEWRACTDWVSDDGKPNLHFFSSHFGKSIVQVADCGSREFTDQKRVEMPVSEFISHWMELPVKGCKNASVNGSRNKSLLYLKDWHFVKEYPDYKAYTTPSFFCDDWLNMYYDNHRMHQDNDSFQEKDEISCSDYRFVYMGPKGTWTPLHADVFRSYSWSSNVCGRKQWHFLSPAQCHLVFDKNLKSTVYNIFEDVNQAKFPKFKEAIWLECTQEQNEIIFVPSGWYHQVHNLEDTISINHNWFNGYNISWVWNLLLRDYNEAKEYIEDIRDVCDDFEGLCQRNLAANTGMNLVDFFIFTARFSLANLVQLYNLSAVSNKSPISSSSPVAQNLALNLLSSREIALKMKSSEALAGKYGVLLDIRKTLKESSFQKLCMVLGRTYWMIHQQFKQNYATHNVMLEHLVESDLWGMTDSQISTPDDLIGIIDLVSKENSLY